jgi:hypothetical protein
MENVGICTEWPLLIFYGHLVYFTALWYISWPLGVCYGHLVNLMAVCYISWKSVIFFPELVNCTKKCLATLLQRRSVEKLFSELFRLLWQIFVAAN